MQRQKWQNFGRVTDYNPDPAATLVPSLRYLSINGANRGPKNERDKKGGKIDCASSDDDLMIRWMKFSPAQEITVTRVAPVP